MKSLDLLAIISIAMVVSMSFTLLAPVIPLQLERRHIDTTFTGIILGCFSIPWVTLPFFLKQSFFDKFSRKSALLIGIVMLGLNLGVYGVLRYIPDSYKASFVASSIITRILQGLGSSLAYIVFIPLISISFPQFRDKALSARSCGSQLGRGVGVALGGAAFAWLGYCGQFLAIGTLTILSSLIVLHFEDADIMQPASHINQLSIGICSFLRVKRVFIALLNYTLLDLVFDIFYPILSLKLAHDFNYNSLQISGAFTLTLAANVIGSSLCLLLPLQFEKRKLILFTNFSLIIGLLLTGPSSILHLPNYPQLLLTGLGVVGFSVGVSKTLACVEMVSGGVAHYPEFSVSVSDSAGKVINLVMGLNALIGSPLASILDRYIGFSQTMDSLSIIFLIYYGVLIIWSAPELKWGKENRDRAPSQDEAEVNMLGIEHEDE